MPANVIETHRPIFPDSKEAHPINTLNAPVSGLLTTLNCCYEFVKSLNPGHGYHKPDDGPMVQFDFRPNVLAESAISAISPVARLFIDAVKFASGNKLLAGSLSLLVDVGRSSASPKSIIEINNAETLQQIGETKDYPINGSYIQHEPINLHGTQFRSIGTEDAPFIGNYDGDGNHISGLNTCLFNKISGDSVVKNVVITDSEINMTATANSRHIGFMACELSGSASLQDNRLANSVSVTHVPYNSNVAGVGIIAGRVSGAARISGCKADNCTITATASIEPEMLAAGSIAGLATDESVLLNNRVNNCSVNVGGFATKASAAVGEASGNVTIYNTSVTGCTVITSDVHTYLGMLAGQAKDNVKIHNTSVTDCTLSVHGQDGSRAGFGAGMLLNNAYIMQTQVTNSLLNSTSDGCNAGGGAGTILDNTGINYTTLTKSVIMTTGRGANAGAGVGFVIGNMNPSVTNTVVDSSKIITRGFDSNAGFTVGHANSNLSISNTVVNNSTVESFGMESDAGGCVGELLGILESENTRIQMENIRIKNSSVITHGKEASAGFAIGRASHHDNVTIKNTVATNSKLETAGMRANAGGGAGELWGQIQMENIRIKNSSVVTHGKEANAGFAVGYAYYDNTAIKNTVAINSKLETAGMYANAGGGAGELMIQVSLQKIRLQNSAISTHGKHAHAAAGAGLATDSSHVHDVLSNNTKIVTTGLSSHAAVGVGSLSGDSVVDKIVAACSDVEAKGRNSSAGIGAGVVADNPELSDILACGGVVRADKNAGIVAGSVTGTPQPGNVTACHVQVNDQLINDHCQEVNCLGLCLPATREHVRQTTPGTTLTTGLKNRSPGQASTMTQQEVQPISIEGVLGLSIALGVPVVYAAVNVARGVKDGLTGLDLVKAPVTYMVQDVQSLIGVVCGTQARGAEQGAIPLQPLEEDAI